MFQNQNVTTFGSDVIYFQLRILQNEVEIRINIFYVYCF